MAFMVCAELTSLFFDLLINGVLLIIWPSVRGGGQPARNIKDHWITLFEQHGVRLAFENHDHAYKRTYPIRFSA